MNEEQREPRENAATQIGSLTAALDNALSNAGDGGSVQAVLNGADAAARSLAILDTLQDEIRVQLDDEKKAVAWDQRAWQAVRGMTPAEVVSFCRSSLEWLNGILCEMPSLTHRDDSRNGRALALAFRHFAFGAFKSFQVAKPENPEAGKRRAAERRATEAELHVAALMRQIAELKASKNAK